MTLATRGSRRELRELTCRRAGCPANDRLAARVDARRHVAGFVLVHSELIYEDSVDDGERRHRIVGEDDVRRGVVGDVVGRAGSVKKYVERVTYFRQLVPRRVGDLANEVADERRRLE